MHRLIAKNTLSQVLIRIVTAGVGFLTTIILARFYGAAGYGDFTKITTIVAFCYLLVDFGLNAIFLHDENKNSFRFLLFLRLLIAVSIAVLLNVIVLILSRLFTGGFGITSTIQLGILFYSLTIITYAITLCATAIFQKKLQYALLMKAQIVGSVVTLVVSAGAAMLHLSLLIILLGFVLGALITSLLALLLTKEKISSFEFSFSFSKKLLVSSLPLGGMLIFNLIFFRADILLLSFFKTTHEVGLYGLAYRFFDFLIALPLFLSNALYPVLVQNTKNPRSFIAVTRSYAMTFLAISLIIIVPFWFISPLFTLINKDFALSILPFRILLISLPIFFLSSFFQWVLIAQKQQYYLMKVYFFVAIIKPV